MNLCAHYQVLMYEKAYKSSVKHVFELCVKEENENKIVIFRCYNN